METPRLSLDVDTQVSRNYAEGDTPREFWRNCSECNPCALCPDPEPESSTSTPNIDPPPGVPPPRRPQSAGLQYWGPTSDECELFEVLFTALARRDT
jgi:hypothetical protein